MSPSTLQTWRPSKGIARGLRFVATTLSIHAVGPRANNAPLGGLAATPFCRSSVSKGTDATEGCCGHSRSIRSVPQQQLRHATPRLNTQKTRSRKQNSNKAVVDSRLRPRSVPPLVGQFKYSSPCQILLPRRFTFIRLFASPIPGRLSLWANMTSSIKPEARNVHK